MNKRLFSVFLPIGLVLVFAAAVAACSSGNDATPTPTKAAATTTKSASGATRTAAAAPTAAPAAATAATTAAAAGATVMTSTNAALGKTILVNAAGKTLYTYANDTSGASNCTGSCASVWPPLAAPSGAATAGPGVTGALATITRADGTKQVTYNGSPLYTFQSDSKAGDATGDGVNSFHAATP